MGSYGITLFLIGLNQHFCDDPSLPITNYTLDDPVNIFVVEPGDLMDTFGSSEAELPPHLGQHGVNPIIYGVLANDFLNGELLCLID